MSLRNRQVQLQMILTRIISQKQIESNNNEHECPNMKLRINTFITALAITGLLACGGGNKALISQAEINSASNSGTLAALYDKAEKLKNESRGSSKKELTAIQSNIAKILVDNRISAVNKSLAGDKTEFGLLDLETLAELNQNIKGMIVWNQAQYQSTKSKIDTAIAVTNNSIQEAESSAAEQSADIVSFLNWKKKAALLSGKNSDKQEKYIRELNRGIDRLSTQGRASYKKRMFNLALKSAQQGIAIDPGNLQFESLLSQSQAALFEQGFQSSLENGKPELAYQSLVDIADKPIMLQIKKKMHRNILLLANYFAGSAKTAYDGGNLYAAYNDFKRARDIQQKLSISNLGFIQEKKYLDILMARADNMESAPGARLGLLSVVKELDPRYPTLNEKMVALKENISNRATTKLAVSEFKEVLSSNSVVASVGRRVSSKLEKILFDKLGRQLQIVAKLATNQDITNTQNTVDYSGIALAIKGEVLQAAIETSANKGQRSINVQTGINRTETEEYRKWSRRKRGEQPTQFDETKIMEDVIINTENIKKTAVVEVAYRIVEPATQKVLLTNNVTKEAQHSGTSTNEFQKGLFRQEYVDAALPSEIKIMDGLATQVSDELGQALLNYLASPEKVFYQKYKDAIERGEIVSGTELLSNAITLAESNSQAMPEWLAALQKLVLSQPETKQE